MQLPLPHNHSGSLTQSQLVYERLTGLLFLAFKIETDDKFYLFMDFCLKYQWVLFKLNAQGWVEAMEVYNQELTALNTMRGITTIPKNPHALIDKLGEMEREILLRIARNNFVCKSI